MVSDRVGVKPRLVPVAMSDAGQTQLHAELMERLNALTEQMERHGKILDEILDRLPPR